MTPITNQSSIDGALSATTASQLDLIKQAISTLCTSSADEDPIYNLVVISALDLPTLPPHFFKIFASICNKKCTFDSRYQLVIENKSADLINETITYHLNMLTPLYSIDPSIEPVCHILSKMKEFHLRYSASRPSDRYNALCTNIENLQPSQYVATLVGSANQAIGIKCTKQINGSFQLCIFDPSRDDFKIKGNFPIKASHVYVYENVPLDLLQGHLWAFFITPTGIQTRGSLLNQFFYPFLQEYRALYPLLCSSSPSRTSVCDVIRLMSAYELGDRKHSAIQTLIKTLSLRLAHQILSERGDQLSLSDLLLLKEAAKNLILRCSKTQATESGYIYKSGLPAAVQMQIVEIAKECEDMIKTRIQVLPIPSPRAPLAAPSVFPKSALETARYPDPLTHETRGGAQFPPLFDSLSIETGEQLERATSEALERISVLSVPINQYFTADLIYPNQIAISEFCLLMSSILITSDGEWKARLTDSDQTLKIIHNLYLILDKIKIMQTRQSAICSSRFINASLKCLLLIAVCTQAYEKTTSIAPACHISHFLNPFGGEAPSRLEELLEDPHFLYLDLSESTEFYHIQKTFHELFPRSDKRSIMDTFIQQFYELAHIINGGLPKGITFKDWVPTLVYNIKPSQDDLSDFLLSTTKSGSVSVSPAKLLALTLSNHHDLEGFPSFNPMHYALRSMFYVFSCFLSEGHNSYKLDSERHRMYGIFSVSPSPEDLPESKIVIGCTATSNYAVSMQWVPKDSKDGYNFPSIGSYERPYIYLIKSPKNLYQEFNRLVRIPETDFAIRLGRLATQRLEDYKQTAIQKTLIQKQLTYVAPFITEASPTENVILALSISAINRSIVVPILALPALFSLLKQRPEVIQEVFNCVRVESQLFKTFIRPLSGIDPVCLREVLVSEEGRFLAIETVRTLIAYYDFTNGKAKKNITALTFTMRLHAVLRSYLENLKLLPDDFPLLPYDAYLTSDLDEETRQMVYWHRAFYAMNRTEITEGDIQKVLEAILYDTKFFQRGDATNGYSYIKHYVFDRLDELKAHESPAFTAEAFRDALLETGFISQDFKGKKVQIIESPSRFQLEMILNNHLYQLDLFNKVLIINGTPESYPLDASAVYDNDDYKSLFGWTQHRLTPRSDGVIFYAFGKEFRFVRNREGSRLEVKMKEEQWWIMLSQPERNTRAGLFQTRTPTNLTRSNPSFSFYDDDDLVYFFDPQTKLTHLIDKQTFEIQYSINWLDAGWQLSRKGSDFFSLSADVVVRAYPENTGPFWLQAIENPTMIEVQMSPWSKTPEEIHLVRFLREGERISFRLKSTGHWVLKENEKWKIADTPIPPPCFYGFKGVIVLNHTEKNKYLLILPEFTFKSPSICIEDLRYKTEISDEHQRKVSRSPIGFAKVELTSSGELIPVAPKDYPQLIYVLLYVGAYEEALKQLKKYNMAATSGKEISLLPPDKLNGDYPADFVALSMHILFKQVRYKLNTGVLVDIEEVKKYYLDCYLPRIPQISGGMLLSSQDELELQELCSLPQYTPITVLPTNQSGAVLTIPPISLDNKYKLKDEYDQVNRLTVTDQTFSELIDRGMTQTDGSKLFKMVQEGRVTDANRQTVVFLAAMISKESLLARVTLHALYKRLDIDAPLVNAITTHTFTLAEMVLPIPAYPLITAASQAAILAQFTRENRHRLDARRPLEREGPTLALNVTSWKERSPLLREIYPHIDALKKVCFNPLSLSPGADEAPLDPIILAVFNKAETLPVLPRLKRPAMAAVDNMRSLLETSRPVTISRFSYHKKDGMEAILTELQPQLEKYKVAIEERKLAILTFSSSILETADAQAVLKRAATLSKPPTFFDLVQCFLSKDKGFYKAVIPGIQDAQIEELFEGTAILLVEMITQTKIEKIIEAAQKYDERDLATVQAFSEVLSQDFAYTHEQIGVLAFEALMGLQLRKEPDQLNIISQINNEILEVPLTEGEIRPLMHFMMAGGGKTTVIFNVVMATCEGALPCAIVPSDLAESTISIFNQCLQKVYGYDVVSFNYPLKDLFKVANLRHILRILQNARRGQAMFYHKTVIVLTKQMCWLLDVAQDLFDIGEFALIDDPAAKEILLEILAEFKQMRPVIDETDLQLKAKEAFNTIFGKDAPIPSVTLKVLREFWIVLLKYDNQLAFCSNEQNLKKRSDYDAILRDLATDLSALECLNLESAYRGGFIEFITGQIDPSVEVAVREGRADQSPPSLFIQHLHMLAHGNTVQREKADAIAMLQHYVTTLLPACLLDRMGKAQYGIARREKKISPVVPFSAPGVPSRNDYAGEREAMTMTMLYFLQFGIDMHSFRSYVTELRDEARRLEMEGWDYQGTLPAQEYSRITGGQARLEDAISETILEEHLSFLNQNRESIISVATWLSSKDIRFYPTRVGSDAYTFFMMFKGATGFSATVLSNFYSLHSDVVKRGAPKEALIAKGDFLRRWIDDSKAGDISLYDPHSFTVTSLIEEYKRNKTGSPLPAAIADPCGEFAKRYSSRTSLMQEIMACYKDSPYKAFIYHDEVTGLPILIQPKWKGRTPAVDEIPSIQELSRNLSPAVYERCNLQVKDIFIYFDPGHCTGADYVFPNDATMLMVMNKMSWSLVLQTQMRKRKRMFSQHICIALNKTFAETLAPAGFDITKPKEAIAILAMSTEIKEASQLSQDAAFGLKKMTNAYYMRICRDCRVRDNSPLLKALTELLIERQSVSYFDAHGSLAIEINTLDELKLYCDHRLTTVKSLIEKAGISLTTPDATYVIQTLEAYNAEILNYATTYLDHILPETSSTTVKGVSDASEAFGAEAVLEVQAEEEAAAETQQQIEIETQVARLYQAYQIPPHFPPVDVSIKPEHIEACITLLKQGNAAISFETGSSYPIFIQVKELLMPAGQSRCPIQFCQEFQGGYDKPYGHLFSEDCLYSADAACYASRGKVPLHVPIFSSLIPREEQFLIVKKQDSGFFAIAISPKELGLFQTHIITNRPEDVWMIDLSANVLGGNHIKFQENLNASYELMHQLMQWSAIAGNMRFFTKYMELTHHWINSCKRKGLDHLLTSFLQLSTQRNYPDCYQTLMSTILNDHKREQMCQRRATFGDTCLPISIRNAIMIEVIEAEDAAAALPSAPFIPIKDQPPRPTTTLPLAPVLPSITPQGESRGIQHQTPVATVVPLQSPRQATPPPQNATSLLRYVIQVNPSGFRKMSQIQKAIYVSSKATILYLAYRFIRWVISDPKMRAMLKKVWRG